MSEGNGFLPPGLRAGARAVTGDGMAVCSTACVARGLAARARKPLDEESLGVSWLLVRRYIFSRLLACGSGGGLIYTAIGGLRGAHPA